MNGRRLHFVGIGGAGMSGLALIANTLGAEVTGSDRATGGPYLERLRAAGIAHHVAANRCDRLGAVRGVAAVGLLAIAIVALAITGLARGRRRRAHDIVIECRSSAEDCARIVALAIGRLRSGGRISVRRDPDRRPHP